MKNLALKLLAFQKEIGSIPKDSENPFFKSKYADINTYIEVVKPILSKHGLILLQPLSNDNGKAALSTIIMDSESGESLDNRVILPENTDPQKMGAIITYFRRYAIQSLLCLQAEDTDAEIGNHTTHSPTTPQKPPQQASVDATRVTDTRTQDEKDIEEIFGAPKAAQGGLTSKQESCTSCGGEKVLNPKTGKIFCKAKCWLKK